MTNLFESGPLQQGTGLLRERWGQDGSNIVNISKSSTVDVTLRTVTASKTIYITSMIIGISAVAAGATDNFEIKDGSGGSRRFRITVSKVIGNNFVYVFDTPLKFETSVYFNSNASTAWNINMFGWEE